MVKKREHIKVLQEDLKWANVTISELGGEIDDLKAQRDYSVNALAVAREERDKYIVKCSLLNQQVENAHAQYAGAQFRLDEELTANTDLRNQLTEARMRPDNLLTEIKELRADNFNLSEQLEDARLRLDALHKQACEPKEEGDAGEP